MISLFDRLVQGGNVTPAVAENNMRIILEALADDSSDNIAVDVKGPILLAPYTDPDNVTHVTLDGNPDNQIPFRGNRAIKCLTFDYGASFATHPLASTNISLVNVQLEADEKAFLFQTINTPIVKKINVSQIYNTVVSVCWFGAVAQNAPNPATAPDSYPAFMAAIACFQRQPITNSTLWSFTVRVPATLGNASVYVIREMISIDSNVSLIGDGKTKSYLTFFNTAGFLIVGTQTGPSTGGQSTISDFNIQCITNQPLTLDKHGIIVRATFNLLNVNINGFDGDGIHFNTSGNVGNGNLSRFINVTCQSNARNGVFVEGDDSNNVLFEHLSIRDNGACGIREEFSLQNTYINCNSENNSFIVNNQSRVSFDIGGVNHYFICIRDITTPGATQSPTNTNFWRQFGTPGGEVTTIYPLWDSTRSYLMSFGFALSVEGNAARTVMSSCYSEGELSIFNNTDEGSGNIIIGGQIPNPGSVSGMIYNDHGAISSRAFSAQTEDTTRPKYRIFGSFDNSGVGYENNGGFNINVPINCTNYSLVLQHFRTRSSFGFCLNNTNSVRANPISFVLNQTLSLATEYARTFPSAAFCLSSFNSPIFIRDVNNTSYRYRLLGLSNTSPSVTDNFQFAVGDFFINSNPSTANNVIGWRCITSSTLTTAAVWQTVNFFQPAAPANFVSTAAPVDYSQTQI